MARGLLIWTLLALLGGVAFESAFETRAGRDPRPRRDAAPGGVHIMDGGDGAPPPPSTI
jgi:hypothetical protein